MTLVVIWPLFLCTLWILCHAKSPPPRHKPLTRPLICILTQRDFTHAIQSRSPFHSISSIRDSLSWSYIGRSMDYTLRDLVQQGSSRSLSRSERSKPGTLSCSNADCVIPIRSTVSQSSLRAVGYMTGPTCRISDGYRGILHGHHAVLKAVSNPPRQAESVCPRGISLVLLGRVFLPLCGPHSCTRTMRRVSSFLQALRC
jgi:hypothetical protein